MTAAIPLPFVNKLNLEATIATGDAIDVRLFRVHEGFSSLFEVHLIVRSKNPDIDFAAVLGRPASFVVNKSGLAGSNRTWQGICNHIEQVEVDEESGASSYQLTIVPQLWFLSQRRNHRMFQLLSEPQIALKILKEWGIEPEVQVDMAAYKDRKYRVQYGESDYAFICRLLEDVGITFYHDVIEGETKLILSDRPTDNPPRPVALPYVNRPNGSLHHDFVTNVRITRQTRPGRYTQRDVDYRRAPSFPLMATAQGDHPAETGLERFHYNPGAFLFRDSAGADTPTADDKAVHRTSLDEAKKQTQKRLEAKQGPARMVVFEAAAADLRPGVVMSMTGHPRSDLAPGKQLLVVAANYDGDDSGDWIHTVEARFADIPYRPPLVTPKPKVSGVESATVTGPAGEEIHVDEFGRVRVHFHWDRESKMDQDSSCWIPVSQPWGGAGYGGMNIPRIGQEVIVDFLGGDPDRPVIIGRVYTNLQKVPYALPANKTKSGWRSNSSPTNGGFNELMFEDAAGRELVRFQAEKDYTGLVKNNSGHVIGNDSVSYVGNNEGHAVVKNHKTQIGEKREMVVGADQVHVVGGEMIAVGRKTSVHKSTEIMIHESDGQILLRVGPSAIILTPKGIVIDAPEVHINPGGVALQPPIQPPVIDGVKKQDGHFFGKP